MVLHDEARSNLQLNAFKRLMHLQLFHWFKSTSTVYGFLGNFLDE